MILLFQKTITKIKVFRQKQIPTLFNRMRRASIEHKIVRPILIE